jgi:hypothetical protein
MDLGFFNYLMKVVEWRSFLVEPTKPGIGKGLHRESVGEVGQVSMKVLAAA